jgi:hypothetical protein
VERVASEGTEVHDLHPADLFDQEKDEQQPSDKKTEQQAILRKEVFLAMILLIALASAKP